MAEINNIDLSFGEVAEQVFKNYYKEYFWFKPYEIRDLSDVLFYRKHMGVDFELMHTYLAERLYVEIKHQRMIRSTGSLFFETGCVFGKNWQDGWFTTTKADYIAFMESEMIDGMVKPIGFHYIKMDSFRRKLKQLGLEPQWINYDSQGYKITLEQLKKDFGFCYDYQDLTVHGLKIDMKKGLEATNF